MSGDLRHRSKRFLYVANKTCGHIAFCSDSIHDPSIVILTALVDDPRCSKFATIVSLLVDVLLSLLITLANTSIILVIKRSKVLNNCQGIFKTSLAFCDLIVGAMVIPGAIYNKLRFLFRPLGESYLTALFRTDNDVINNIFGFALTISISGSLTSLFLLSLDRYLAVTRPYLYRQGTLMTPYRAYGLICMIWVVALFLSTVPFGDPTNFHYTVDYMTLNFLLEIKLNPVLGHYYHGFFFLVIVFIIPYISVVTVTVVTWLKLWKERRGDSRTKWERRIARNRVSPVQKIEIRIQNADESVVGSTAVEKESAESDTDTRNSYRSKSSYAAKAQKWRRVSKQRKTAEKEMRIVTRTIFLIILVFSLCVLPFLFTQMTNLIPRASGLSEDDRYEDQSTPVPHNCNPILYIVVLHLMYCNSFSNFLIYNLRNENFRREFLQLIFRRREPVDIVPPATRDLQFSQDESHNESMDTSSVCSESRKPSAVPEGTVSEYPMTLQVVKEEDENFQGFQH